MRGFTFLKLGILKLILISQIVQGFQNNMEQRIMEKLNQMQEETQVQLISMNIELTSINNKIQIINGNYAEFANDAKVTHAKINHVYDTIPNVLHEISVIKGNMVSIEEEFINAEENLFDIKKTIVNGFSQYQCLQGGKEEQLSAENQHMQHTSGQLQNATTRGLMEIYRKIDGIVDYLGKQFEVLQRNLIDTLGENTTNLMGKITLLGEILGNINISNEEIKDHIISCLDFAVDEFMNHVNNIKNESVRFNNALVNRTFYIKNKLLKLETRDKKVIKELSDIRKKLPCFHPFVTIPSTDECVYICSDYATFAEANATCSSYGATLVIPQNITVISDFIADQGFPFSGGVYWIGADDSSGTWQWLNGSEVSHSLWRRYMPEDLGTPGERCALLDTPWDALTYGDVSMCNDLNQWRFICEM
ncbi:unnamed protein product [Meganyctiphanes norvegica]|uniref:C-type lectin domain-containing protein n=1 Tax=Meganyctiphanes norvegica TaxID=48144 RepID=A0AAV2RHH2_MEGNR